MPMKNPPHPGLSVRFDCLAPLDLTVTEAARRLGVSRKQLSDVVNGRSGISPEMAIRLDKAFGGGAAAWYQLQAAYDLAQAMQRSDDIPRHADSRRRPTMTSCRRNVPLVELRPRPKPPRMSRPVGRDRTMEVPASFFEPLPQDLLRAFAGGIDPS